MTYTSFFLLEAAVFCQHLAPPLSSCSELAGCFVCFPPRVKFAPSPCKARRQPSPAGSRSLGLKLFWHPSSLPTKGSVQMVGFSYQNDFILFWNGLPEELDALYFDSDRLRGLPMVRAQSFEDLRFLCCVLGWLFFSRTLEICKEKTKRRYIFVKTCPSQDL